MVEIFGTLGPACAKAEVLELMLRAGMTGLRLNLSHGSLRQAGEQLAALRFAEERSGLHAKLLIDMQGPELRIDKLEQPLPLLEGKTVLLGKGGVPLPDVVWQVLEEGQEILLDDGKLAIRYDGRSRAKVLRGGLLQSRKSVALPGINIRLPALTESDRENLSLAAKMGVAGVMQPFVRCRADLETVRACLNENGGEAVRLFAKIENLEGVEHLEELMDAADEIVIARGDLGNSVELWELPRLQKRIAAACRAAGKPFMVVTQMLASMERSPVPTRAEVSDIYNAVLDGASSVMVTGETAMGQYPAEVIHYLTQTVRTAEEDL